MKGTSINIYRTKEHGIDFMKNLLKENILDKGGKIAFNWIMQQCGSTIWYDALGYVPTQDGEEYVKIRYNYL